MIYQPLIPFKTTVANDLEVCVREVTPDDRELISIGFDHLSKQSRYFRFLAARSNLTEKELRKFAERSDHDHVAIGASCAKSGVEQPVAIARFIRTEAGHSAAEMAITVIDGFQGHGLGTLLLGCLCRLAVRNDISTFVALVHRDNQAMRQVLKNLGAQEREGEGLEVELSMPLYSDPNDYPETSSGRLVRRAYAIS